MRLASVLARHSVGAGKLAEFLTAWQRLGGKVLAAWEAVRTGFSTDSAYRWAKKLCPQSGRGPRRGCAVRVPRPPPTGEEIHADLFAHLALVFGKAAFTEAFQIRFPRALACRGGIQTRIVRRKSKMEAKKVATQDASRLR